MSYRRRGLLFRPRNKNNIKAFQFFLACFLAGAVVFSVNARLHPLIRELVRAKVNIAATRAINLAISEELQTNGEMYAALVKLEKDDGGRIAALHTDMMRINRLKTELIQKVLTHINCIEGQEVEVPIGNLSGVNLLSGRGPSLPVKIVPASTAAARFISVFSEAGINQSKHELIMELSVDVGILVPGASTSTVATSQIVVSETILVGSVPQSYTYIDDTQSSRIEKLNDYGELKTSR